MYRPRMMLQKPVVAVVASFNPKAGNYFSLPDLETLMHELGHALHSLLSRTQFQHLSGKLVNHKSSWKKTILNRGR